MNPKISYDNFLFIFRVFFRSTFWGTFIKIPKFISRVATVMRTLKTMETVRTMQTMRMSHLSEALRLLHEGPLLILLQNPGDGDKFSEAKTSLHPQH